MAARLSDKLEGRPVSGVSSMRFGVTRVRSGVRCDDADGVAIEEPLEIRLDYETRDDAGEAVRRQRSISITMRTPGNDLELAVGFLFTEGIIREPGHVLRVEHCGPPVGAMGLRNVVKVVLASGVGSDLDRLERHFYTSSSCGVCGKTSLEALRVQTRYTIDRSRLRIAPTALIGLPQKLLKHQAAFGTTGGIHASAKFDASGEILAVREDVGRHNALDKLIGAALAAEELPLAGHGVLVSGRASFELMQKAVMAGAPMVAAVGAPSSLAVEQAREFGVCLVGFLRDGRFNIYAGADCVDQPWQAQPSHTEGGYTQ